MDKSDDRQGIFAVFNGCGKVSLTELSLSLLTQQKAAWSELRLGYDALAFLKQRRIQVGDATVVLQCNPRRIKSTGAVLDPASIRARPCFLCRENLPEAQKGILYRDKFLVLCNPAPIFPAHFTIALIEHIPQSLIMHLPSLLDMAKDFSPDLALLYNGPRSGASAPDHLHFQAFIRASIPDIDDAVFDKRQVRKGTRDTLLLSTTNGERPAILVEGTDRHAMERCLIQIIDAMRRVLAVTDEPMLNLFCLYDGAKWRVVIYPRRRHRPDVFYKLGEEQIFITPGAVEMGGLLVLPREEDYERLDAHIIREIFLDVALEQDRVEEIISAVESDL